MTTTYTAEQAVDTLAAEGHDRDDAIAVVGTLIDAGLELIQPAAGALITAGELDLVRDQLASYEQGSVAGAAFGALYDYDTATDAEIAAEADRRAANGAAVLDRYMPGWAERIDLARLDLGSLEQCVLGQLHPDERRVGYSELCDLGVVDHDPICTANFHLGGMLLALQGHLTYADRFGWLPEHGFNADESLRPNNTDLDDAWARQVTCRMMTE